MVVNLRIEILLRQIRKEKGITLEELSAKTGIAKSHLSNIERQEKDISFKKMCIIAKVLNVKLEELYKIIN